MAEYVDGFVVAVPKKNIDEYKKVARTMGKMWLELGALEVRESIADDVPFGKITSFPRAVERKNSEVVVFSWIIHKSRAQRDKTNALAMKDPRVLKMMKEDPIFDSARMIYGGFETIVKL